MGSNLGVQKEIIEVIVTYLLHTKEKVPKSMGANEVFSKIVGVNCTPLKMALQYKI